MISSYFSINQAFYTLFLTCKNLTGHHCTNIKFSIKNVALFKTKEQKALASLILYYLQSGLLDIQIGLLSRGGAQGFLSLGDIRNLIFPKIPGNEIDAVVTYLEDNTKKFDEIISHTKGMIDLLQERRTALISAAVTGKIDVRNWQPPTDSQNSPETL